MAKARKTYTVHAVRSAGWWALSVPEIRGVHSQVRRLEEADPMAREAIALMLEVPEDSFDVYVIPIIDESVLDEKRVEVVALRSQLADMKTKVDELQRQFAQQSAAAGVPVRDIAEMLGVSFQYAAKLARAS